MEPNLKESIRRILSIPKIKSSGLHIDDIATHVKNENSTLFTENESFEVLKKKINTILLTDVNRKTGSEFSKVKNSKTGKFKKGYYKLISPVKETKLPVTPIDIPKPHEQSMTVTEEPVNLFIGKAGECAVISELLFRGYNANLMMVDDSVDIVAGKNNVYYFLQVKTSQL